MPKWLAKIATYIAAFTYGAYVYGTIHGHTPELYRWVTTGFFGIFFYYQSLKDTK